VPPSTNMAPVADANMMTVSIGGDKLFFAVTEQDVRAAALKAMGDKYGVTFSPEETQRFSLTQIFGVPMKSLKSFLDTDPDKLKDFTQTGIPADTTNNNELFNWIYTSRQAEKALHDKDLQMSIKGDSKEQYPEINIVISCLEKQKLFKFELITSLKSAPNKK